jgi:hypothetical protein
MVNTGGPMHPDNAFRPALFSFPQWQLLYESALLEFDREELSHRIMTAESAIQNRLASIEGDSNQHDAEREAIEAALLGLNYLRELAGDYRH